MISFAFRRSRQAGNVAGLYGTIVAQARSPAFYRDYGVPDTTAARIDMIMLHLVLALRRMRDLGAEGRRTGQALFDRFCQDMDDNFREMGVGDLAVPREMRRIGEAFYGRAKAYDAALDADDAAALAAALQRNVFAAAEAAGAGVERLTAYMLEASRRLRAEGEEAVRRGAIAFPDPETVTPAELRGDH